MAKKPYRKTSAEKTVEVLQKHALGIAQAQFAQVYYLEAAALVKVMFEASDEQVEEYLVTLHGNIKARMQARMAEMQAVGNV